MSDVRSIGALKKEFPRQAVFRLETFKPGETKSGDVRIDMDGPLTNDQVERLQKFVVDLIVEGDKPVPAPEPAVVPDTDKKGT